MPRHRGMTFRKFIAAVAGESINRYFIKIGHPLPDNMIFSEEAPLQKFMDTLPEEIRSGVLEDFQTINDITERGMSYIEKAVAQDGIQIYPDDTREQAAMRLFLDHQTTFQKSYDRYLCLTIGATIRPYKLNGTNADFSPQQLEIFKNNVADYYQKCMKGGGCSVRSYNEDNCHYIVVARGDYMKSDMKWENGTTKPIFYRPGKEDILIYDPVNKILRMKTAGKGDDPKKKYIELFGNHILKTVQPASVYTQLMISLEPLKNKAFYDGNDDIKIKLLELAGGMNGTSRLKIRLGSADLLKSIDEDLELSLTDIDLDAVTLKFTLKTDGVPLQTIPIEITKTSIAGLTKKQGKEIIEDYLKQQNVILY